MDGKNSDNADVSVQEMESVLESLSDTQNDQHNTPTN